MTAAIEQLRAREILDSRGQPTLEVSCRVSGGGQGVASVPAGASTGSQEAKELRDHDPERFGGRGVRQAIAAIQEEIGPALYGSDVTRQVEIDKQLAALDGTDDKSRLGANAILGVSLAAVRAGALASGQPLYRYCGSHESDRLPVPSFNVLNGGLHAAWQGADFQEYMIVPHAAGSVTEAVRWAAEIYASLKSTLKGHGVATGVGDEGGFAPSVASNRQPLDWLAASIDATGLKPGDDVSLAIDAAASALWRGRAYELATEQRALTADELIDYYIDLVADYPISILEDGVRENSWNDWQHLAMRLGHCLTLIGDDVFVTRKAYIEHGIELQCANAVLIKPNQVGTVTETLEAAWLAHRAGWQTMVSHRSGETTDDFIADLAVALRSRYIKAGAPARGERVAKYNRLMAIEAELGKDASFAGTIQGAGNE